MTESFADLGVSAPVCRALAKRGITSPFPVQQMVMPAAMEAVDLLVRAPTGSGKTLAFGLPVLERLRKDGGLQALVLAPTRELVSQIHTELAPLASALSLTVAPVYGGVDPRSQAQKASRAHILVATPGRLNDLLRNGRVRPAGIEVVVLDEADRMLDMGFLPQVQTILEQTPSERTTLLFSATLDGEVGRLAERFTREPVRLQLDDAPADGPTLSERLEQTFTPCTPSTRIDTLIELIGDEQGLALVFCRTKRGADRLADRLITTGISAGAIHGDLRQNARDRALRQFATGRLRVLVATDVASRGIDLDDVSLVVNFDPPDDASAYTHRVGRTARAGRTGRAVTFMMPEHAAQLHRMAVSLGLDDNGTVGGYTPPPSRPAYSRGRRPGAPRSRPRTPAAPSTPGRNRVRRGSRTPS